MSQESGGEQGGSQQPAEVFRRFREKLLRGTAASLGLEPEGRVWGVVMEMGYPEGTVLLACLADGSAELYLSHGGGLLGGGEHESVRMRAKPIVDEAERFISEAEPVETEATPVAGRVVFRFLTDEQTFAADVDERRLANEDHELSPLYRAGQAVIAELAWISQDEG